MAVTYAELTTQILDYTEVSTDVLTATRTNDFIEHAENRIFRDVDLDVFKSHQTANLIASNAFYHYRVERHLHQNLLVLLEQCRYFLLVLQQGHF